MRVLKKMSKEKEISDDDERGNAGSSSKNY